MPSGKEELLTTLAEVGSVLGSVGGLSITVGSEGGRAGFFKQRACMRHGPREVRAVSERLGDGMN